MGTCGFSGRGGRKNYYSNFSAVEVQETFYRPVPTDTLRRWRSEAPNHFEFTVKAFQGITHPASSPTWKRAGRFKPTPGHGFFKPTKEVFEGWELTRSEAQALGASVVVFQTPPSFGPSEENLLNIDAFFTKIDRGSFVLGWEPRGEWYNHTDLLEQVLRRHNLVHVVDPFRHMPLVDSKVQYFRLHGIGRGEVNYSYKYTDEDLARLLSIVDSLSASKVYVFFNNIYMFDDALRFKEMVERR